MNNYVLILFIISILFLSACSKTKIIENEKENLEQNFCANITGSCSNIEYAERKIKEITGLEAKSYSILCIECNLLFDVELKVVIEKNEEYYEISYDYIGGGSSWNSDSCFSSLLGQTKIYNFAKENLCNQITLKMSNRSPTCEGAEPYDLTPEIQNNCTAGQFEYVVGKKNIISIHKGGNSCGSSSRIGKHKEGCI